MGVELYVILRKKIPSAGKYADTKALVFALPSLDLKALELGVTPISKFVPVTAEDIDFMRKFLSDRGLPIQSEEKPREGWFLASEGLQTIRALIKELNPKKNEIEHRHVIDGLEYVEQQLAVADEQGIQFHFFIQ